jgi:predicted DNA-binding transcriptional regulator YafY
VSRTERLYRIERMLRRSSGASVQQLCEELSVSRATVVRDLRYLRDRLAVPLKFDRDGGVYRLEISASNRFPLPSLWFTSGEISGLLLTSQLLRQVNPGAITQRLEPFKSRLEALVAQDAPHAADVAARISFVPARRRRVDPRVFEVLAEGLLSRRRLRVEHRNRHLDLVTRRDISPLQMINYRGNWLLEAHCHLRGAFRRFSADAICSAELLPAPAETVELEPLESRLRQGYGLFDGSDRPIQWAKLRFSAYRARWVADEFWHIDQRCTWTDTGELILELPFKDTRDLVADVLRYGGDCTVLAPAELREAVLRRVDAVRAAQSIDS